jgi:hypothetical protein
MGLLFLLGAHLLAAPFGLPVGLLRWTGVILVPFAASLFWIASRPIISAAGVRWIVAANALWAIGTPLLLLTSWASPTPLGEVFVVAQAVAVAGFAYIERRALR